MNRITRIILCAILFIICFLILNYLNNSNTNSKEGFKKYPYIQPEWLANHSNNLPPPYKYRYVN